MCSNIKGKVISLCLMKKRKKPWPTLDVMKQIYKENLWGESKEEDDFYSGDGSHNTVFVTPYINSVVSFLESSEEKLVVCDLGCGDFNIGALLYPHCYKYIGVDIVPELIERNRFKYPQIDFHCLDISSEALPKADVAIVRQVLQHLSNIEIARIAIKLLNYKYIIITEHVPDEPYVANKDIISGRGIRLKLKSGVDLTKPPFCLSFLKKKELLSIPDNQWKGVIKTTLIQTV